MLAYGKFYLAHVKYVDLEIYCMGKESSGNFVAVENMFA